MIQKTWTPDIEARGQLPIWARLELMRAGVPFNDVIGFCQWNPYTIDLMYFREQLEEDRPITHTTWISLIREIG